MHLCRPAASLSKPSSFSCQPLASVLARVENTVGERGWRLSPCCSLRTVRLLFGHGERQKKTKTLIRLWRVDIEHLLAAVLLWPSVSPCHLLCAAILSRLLWSAAVRTPKHTHAVESASSHLHQFPAAPSEPNWLLSAPRPCCPIWPSAPPMSFPDPRWHIRSCRLMALRSMAQITECCTSAPLFLALSVSLSHQQRNPLLACFERFTKFSWRKCFILRKKSRQWSRRQKKSKIIRIVR